MNLTELFITEPKHKTDISELKFLDLLNSKCKNSHNIMKKTPIFKEDIGSDFMLVHPKKLKSNFWVDELIKELKSWNSYPSRNKFIKGYNSLKNINDENNTYVVIPFDNSRIGVCTSTSFYRSFNNVEKSMIISRVDNDGLVSWIQKLQECISTFLPNIKPSNLPTTFSEFKKCLSTIDEILKDNKNKLKQFIKNHTELDSRILSNLLDRYVINIETYLNEIFNPDENNFSVIGVESLSNFKNECEMWISNPCLLIRRSKYIELHKNGIIK